MNKEKLIKITTPQGNDRLIAGFAHLSTLINSSIILQIIRSEEFAPTKNLTGPDSVETSRQMMVSRSADWLESAGVSIPRKPDGSSDCLLEIAPSFAVEKDDIQAKLNQIPKIKPKDKFYLA